MNNQQYSAMVIILQGSGNHTNVENTLMVLLFQEPLALCFLQETAINIGYSSCLIDQDMDIIVINATSMVRIMYTWPLLDRIL